MKNIFFDSWESLARTFIISLLAYLLMIFLLRVSGKRTLSKMNAFDFIVTIALGSTLATVLLNKNVALADGLVAFIMLIYLQYIITFFSVRSKKFNALIKASPTLLVFRGELIKRVMIKERITEDEVYFTIREKGFSTIKEVDAVVLETDGSLTVLESVDSMKSDIMKTVRTTTNREDNNDI